MVLLRSQAGRAVLANVESNINSTNNARGKRKPQSSSSWVAEPGIGVENEDNDDEVTTSLCDIHGQTQLHCCHQLHSATIIVCTYGVSMHDMLADMGLQVLVASRSAKTNMRAFTGIRFRHLGARPAKISEVNKEMDCKSGSKAAGKSLQPRVTRSQSVEQRFDPNRSTNVSASLSQLLWADLGCHRCNH